MKFLLVPLLIIGMFVSFLAAVVAMLFFTKTVETPQQLKSLVLGGKDSTQLFEEEFRLKEDQLAQIFTLAEQYKTLYEAQSQQAEVVQESLAVERTRLQALADSLMRVEQQLKGQSDSAFKAQRQASVKELAKFYDKIKPQLAAEILQQGGELSDTTVAMLLKQLQPGQMAKIMGNMTPDFAARLTNIMQELSP